MKAYPHRHFEVTLAYGAVCSCPFSITAGDPVFFGAFDPSGHGRYKFRLIRDGVVYWEGTLSSLKRFKDDAREVTNGFECGMSFTNFHDFKEGDHVECYEIVEEKRHFA